MKKHSRRKIAAIVGEEHVQSSPEDMICYGYDASSESSRPDLVAHPGTVAEVADIVREASLQALPIVPRGAGTGLSGGALASQGGIVMQFDRMNRILTIDKEDMVAVVQPGVINWDLKQAAAETGLFYPPDPGSTRFCTLGGNVAENAGGPYGAHYGVTSDYVLGLEAVLASGEIITAGGRNRRDVAGYDLTGLLVGSEGTLAIITEMTLRLLAAPASRAGVFLSFEDFTAAIDTVRAIIGSGSELAAIEIMDHTTLDCLGRFMPGRLPSAGAVLLMEAHGNEACVRELLDKAVSEANKYDGEVIETAEDDDCEGLWELRRAVAPSLGRIAPDKIGEDVCVPVGKIGAMHDRIREISDRYQLTIAVFGHVGDGNLHPNILTDRRNSEMMDRTRGAIDDLFAAAVDLGGTISGEHGIGVTKSPYLAKVRDAESIDIMLRIKRVFDPKGILNPGKIFAA